MHDTENAVTEMEDPFAFKAGSLSMTFGWIFLLVGIGAAVYSIFGPATSAYSSTYNIGLLGMKNVAAILGSGAFVGGTVLIASSTITSALSEAAAQK